MFQSFDLVCMGIRLSTSLGFVIAAPHSLNSTATLYSSLVFLSSLYFLSDWEINKRVNRVPPANRVGLLPAFAADQCWQIGQAERDRRRIAHVEIERQRMAQKAREIAQLSHPPDPADALNHLATDAAWGKKAIVMPVNP